MAANNYGARSAVLTPVLPRQPQRYAATESQSNPAVAVGVPILLFWIFIFFSRILDVTFWYLKLPIIAYILTATATLVSGNFMRIFQTRIGKFISLYTLWICLSAPFGIWRTGSLPSINSAVTALVLSAAIVGLISTPRQLLKILYTLALSSLTAAILSYFFGLVKDGRLQLYQGTLKDPNEFAMILLMGVPFWIMIIHRSNKLLKFVGLLALLPILHAFVLAGSRGGLVGAGMLLLFLFFQGSLAQRVAFAMAGIVLVVTASLTLPQYLRERYFTLFQAEEVAGLEDAIVADANSALARRDLLVSSLLMTLKHPLLGVGPGNFADAYFNEGKEQGIRRSWNVSHNSYTQVSSEIGIPGFLFFVTSLFFCFRALRNIRKLRKANVYIPPDLLIAVQYTRLSMVVVCTCAAFLSMAYDPIFYVFAGICAVAERLTSSYVGQHLPRPAPVMRPPMMPLPVSQRS